MWSFLKRIFNVRSKPVLTYSEKEELTGSTSNSERSLPDEENSKKGVLSGIFQPRFDLVDFSSQDDDESVHDTISTAARSFDGTLEDDKFSLSEMKPNDRARRDEIIDTLNELGVINMAQAQQISNSKLPNPRFHLGSPRSKGFILVNNHLGFPPGMDLSLCFIDYLNFRCHSGDILSRLLSREVALQPEEDLCESYTYETAAVFNLVQKRDVFYSFCLGKVVNQEEVEHCLQCHVCFEHSFWSCKTCGATTARLCQLCYPEVSCDFCEPQQETESDGSEDLAIIEESDRTGSYDSYNWKSLQSLSELAIEEPEPENTPRRDSYYSGYEEKRWDPTNADSQTSRYESESTSDDEYEIGQEEENFDYLISTGHSPSSY